MSMELELELELVAPPYVAARPRVARNDLRRFLLLQGLAQGADAGTTVALAQVVVFSLEHGATPATMIRALLTGALPYVLALPVAGLVSDRYARRRSLANVQLLRAMLTLASISVPLTRSAPLGYMFVVALMASSGLANFIRSASLPHVTSPHRLLKANSWSSLVAKLSGVVAMSLGVAIARSQPATFLAATALVHACAGIGYRAWECDLGGRLAAGQTIHFRQIRARTADLVMVDAARTSIRAALAHRTLQGMAMMLYIVLAEQRFDLGGSAYALAIGATAVGTFLGTTITTPLLNRQGAEVAGVLAWAGSALALTVLATAPMPATGIVALVIVGAAFQVTRLTADSNVQLSVADEALGRVYSIYDASFQIALLTGSVIAYCSRISPPAALIAVAFAHIAAGLLQQRLPRPLTKE